MTYGRFHRFFSLIPHRSRAARRNLLTLCAGAGLVAAVASCGAPPPAAEPPKAAAPVSEAIRLAAGEITPANLIATVAALSDDEFEGRGPATKGDRQAQSYIASRMAELGLEPGAADGTWSQPFDVVGITAAAPKTWTFRGPSSKESFGWWDEYIAASGVQAEKAEIRDAEVVFVGYGIEAPEYQWDDYKGQDLTGKVLLMLNNDPDWDPQLFAGNLRLYYGRWTYKYEVAGRKGAAGAIIIHTTPSAGYPFQVVQTSWTGPQFELPAGDEPRSQINAWLTWDAASRLTASAGKSLDELVEAAKSRDFQPVPLGLKTTLTLTNTLERAQTGNVLGLLRGSDPKLAQEAVVFTAHHDHLGIGEPDADGDRIYNGARDNAAGVAQLLAIAKAFTRATEKPRRSIVFAAVGAEEQGLLGSRYYARHPTFPPGKIVANLNFDGPNIWGRTRDLPLVGKGKSNLDELAEQMAALQGRHTTSESDPTQGSFYRSDQFNFAKIGVPALYFDEGKDFVDTTKGLSEEVLKTWNLKNYHQPSDEIEDSWDLSGAAEDAQVGFYCGWVLANQDALPAWNPGDEFEAARKAALAAVAGQP